MIYFHINIKNIYFIIQTLRLIQFYLFLQNKSKCHQYELKRSIWFIKTTKRDRITYPSSNVSKSCRFECKPCGSHGLAPLFATVPASRTNPGACQTLSEGYWLKWHFQLQSPFGPIRGNVTSLIFCWNWTKTQSKHLEALF